MKIKCLIVDDEHYARKLMEDYVMRIPDLMLAGMCKNTMEAMHVMNQQDIDLLLLDIQMPDLTGIEFLKTLPRKPLVIFTTAYQEYALDGYELGVIDYMLKPISFERFLKGINKAIEQLRLKQRDTDKPMASGESLKPQEGFINVKADYKIYKLRHEKILFIEGLKEYVTFYTDDRKYVVLESLKRLEQILPSGQFLRVHKSYIINIGRVDSLYGNLIEIGKNQVPIGKSYADQVKAVLFRL